MTRILVYSHDTYGLGNIRRMLAISMHLAATMDNASVLVVSGSPMLHGFRIAPGIDYIKLPSVTRTVREGYATRSLSLETSEVFELRANVLVSAVADFRPDVILVDKKPFGIERELEAAIDYAKAYLPRTSLVLVLRDILDEPEATIRSWRGGQYTEAIERYYDRVLVLGTPLVFDVRREYELPGSVCEKLRFCGYLRRPLSERSGHEVRRDLGLTAGERLVLVTAGGGQDGACLLETYAAAAPSIHSRSGVRSLIVTGPEMDTAQRRTIARRAAATNGVEVREFTDDMMGWLEASDAVVCMGGYNTVCEVATLRKRAVVIPRVHPVQEQWIRAQRLSRLGVVEAIHPDDLDRERLASAVIAQLDGFTPPTGLLDLGGLPRIAHQVRNLLRDQTPIAVPHAGLVGAAVSAPDGRFARYRIA